MKRPRILLTLCLTGWILAYAQDGPGGTAGSPFRMGFDARSIGLGNAMAARDLDDNPAVYNPALLPFVTSRSALLGAATLPLDRSLFHISYSTPLPPSAGLGLSASGARVGDIQGRDLNGRPTEVYTTNEYAVALAFGLRPSPDITIGAAARLLHARLIPEVTSTTVGLDFGASYLVTDEILIAAVVRDVNSKYRWDTTPVYGRDGNNTVDVFPTRLIVGVGWTPNEAPFSGSVEGERIAGSYLLRAGFDYRVHPDVTIRAGLDGYDPDGKIGTRAMAGLSVENLDITWNPSFDYAFVLEPFAAPGGHFFTIRLHFGE